MKRNSNGATLFRPEFSLSVYCVFVCMSVCVRVRVYVHACVFVYAYASACTHQ